MPSILRTAALLSLMSCAPNAVPSERAGDAPLVGIVRVVGSAPVNVRVVLQRPEGAAYELAGALRDELATLAGAEVAVSGRTSDSADPMTAGTVDVIHYRIVSVDGEPVVMGTIAEIEGGRALLRTEDGRELLLSPVPETFRVGQKVWVQGPTTMAVQSYGVLRR